VLAETLAIGDRISPVVLAVSTPGAPLGRELMVNVRPMLAKPANFSAPETLLTKTLAPVAANGRAGRPTVMVEPEFRTMACSTLGEAWAGPFVFQKISGT
jgi:hypothetical protein